MQSALNDDIYKFSIDYDMIDLENILNIHDYLKKNVRNF